MATVTRYYIADTIINDGPLKTDTMHNTRAAARAALKRLIRIVQMAGDRVEPAQDAEGYYVTEFDTGRVYRLYVAAYTPKEELS